MSNENGKPWYKNPRIIAAIIVAIGGIVAAFLHIPSTPPEEPELSTIQGVVTDTGGMPMAGAVVEINGLSATTDASGVYVIRDVSVGTKTIIVHAPGAEVIKRAIKIAKGGEIIVFDVVLPSPVAPTPAPSLKITYPCSGGRVQIKEIVKGTSQNIPKEYAIWIVIYSHEVSRYHPQDYPADVQANGDWSSSAFIGIGIDVGKKFDIIAVLAGKEAQNAFNDYLEECKEKKSWPGLERLHEGAVIYDRITVIRK